MSTINNIFAREILDSRGKPTVEAIVKLSSGDSGMASVPSGESTGSREALELRDHDDSRYNGLGVTHAVNNINTIIADKLVNTDISSQEDIDQVLIELDGTENKSKLGANALLAVSIASVKARAAYLKKPLFQTISPDAKYNMPVPFMNVINGGAHASNNVDIQEFMIVPHGASCFSESLRYGAEIFYSLGKILSKQGYSTSVGDEGGFASDLKSTTQALDLIIEAIEDTGLTINKDVSLALDVAATELYTNKIYNLKGEQKSLDSQQFVEYLQNLIDTYPIISIEDGMAEDDWDGWKILTDQISKSCQVVGDDLFVTNKVYLSRGIEQNIANAILIKLNQIGTVTETINTISLAKDNNYSYIISHRSGETEDTFIADFAVATCAGQIKTGSLSRTDRIAKYNRLLRIEDEYSDLLVFPGIAAINCKI